MALTVRVFRNLTAGPRGKAPVYSIQAKVGSGWRTVAHASYVCLSNTLFTVSASGVARIRATKKKTVVATIQGELQHWDGVIRPAGETFGFTETLERTKSPGTDFPDVVTENWFQSVTFNPFKMDTFQVSLTGAPILRASTAWVGRPGVVVPVEA